MNYYIDIDGTICTHEANGNYQNAKPFMDRIEKINKLYDDGNTVTYWTARGTTTGIDWIKVTLEQFKKWGVKFHELKFGKPAYNVFVDNQAFNDKEFFKDNE